MISAKVKRKQLIKNYPEKLITVNRQFLPLASKIVKGDAELLAPVKDGLLRKSFKERIEQYRAIVSNPVEYASDVEYGTRPHQITVNGPVNIKGVGWRYLKTVNHPGTQAQPYMRPAIDNNRTKLLRLYRKIFRSVYRG